MTDIYCVLHIILVMVFTYLKACCKWYNVEADDNLVSMLKRFYWLPNSLLNHLVLFAIAIIYVMIHKLISEHNIVHIINMIECVLVKVVTVE